MNPADNFHKSGLGKVARVLADAQKHSLAAETAAKMARSSEIAAKVVTPSVRRAMEPNTAFSKSVLKQMELPSAFSRDLLKQIKESQARMATVPRPPELPPPSPPQWLSELEPLPEIEIDHEAIDKARRAEVERHERTRRAAEGTREATEATFRVLEGLLRHQIERDAEIDRRDRRDFRLSVAAVAFSAVAAVGGVVALVAAL